MYMFYISGTYIKENLRILILQASNAFGKSMIQRFIKSNWNKIGSLNIGLGINYGVTYRDIKFWNRCKCKHIGSNKFILHAIMTYI